MVPGGANGLPSAPAAAADEFDRDATIRVAWAAGLNGWDPMNLPSASPAIPFLSSAYDALLTVDADGQLAPQLAESWEYDDDRTALTLHLREGVVFQDGAAFDAEAAKASLERSMRLITPAAQAPIDFVESVEVIDDYTIQVNLSAPDPQLLNSLAFYAGFMISPNQVESDNLSDSPAGAGPWKPILEETTPAVAVFERFEDYWDPEFPRAARLEIHVIQDELTRLNAFRSGQLDAMIVFANGYEDAAAEAEASGGNLYAYPNPLIYGFYTNAATEPALENADVRRALSLAIDRQLITDELLAGQCGPTTQLLGPGVPGHDPALEEVESYDPDAARELLEQAGATDLSLTLLVPTNDPYSAIAQVVQEQWAQVGVEVSIELVPGSESYAAYRDRGFNFFHTNVAGGPVPTAALGEYIARGALGNVPAEFQEAVDAARQLDPTSAEGAEALREINAGLVEYPIHILICRFVQNFLTTSQVVGGDALPWLRVTPGYSPRDLAILK